MKRFQIIQIVALVFLVGIDPSTTSAHSGGLDDNSGHINRTTGIYHCHPEDNPHCILPGQTTTGFQAAPITVASFNIQFLGNSNSRDDAALAAVVAEFDIVAIQELVSPPYAGTFPDGSQFNPDPQSAEFFDAMQAHGFEFVLSPEDTGTGEVIHRNGSSTEWWVVFFQPDRVTVDDTLQNGFLAEDRSNHANFERVPFAFGFHSVDGDFDFVLISTHLKPGTGSTNRARRAEELNTINQWIQNQAGSERDYVILGDMNLYRNELAALIPDGLQTLNDQCLRTNTASVARCYDHVLYNPVNTSEVDADSFRVIDLIDRMRPFWQVQNPGLPYPGDPYEHNTFRSMYSDHHPIAFSFTVTEADDDP